MADIAIQAAEVSWKLLKPVLGFVIAAGIGLGAGEFLEHRGPSPAVTLFGHRFHLLPESLKAQLDDFEAAEPAKISAARAAGVQQQAASDAPAFTRFSAALATARNDLATARNASASAIAKADTFTHNQTAVAFRLGRATCEAPHATSPSGAPGALPDGVRDGSADDFADVFNPGAYTPSGQAPVPAGGDGADTAGAPSPQGR